MAHQFFPLTILFLYVLLAPFYIFESGVAQPADFIMAVGLAITAFFAVLKPRFQTRRVYMIALCFGLYALLINLVHYSFLPDKRFLLSSLYYLYNAALFIFTATLLRRSGEKAQKILYAGVVLSVFVEFVFLKLFAGGEGLRLTGSFDNPNPYTAVQKPAAAKEEKTLHEPAFRDTKTDQQAVPSAPLRGLHESRNRVPLQPHTRIRCCKREKKLQGIQYGP